MKKIMYFMTVLTIIFFFLFSIFTFLCEENANFATDKYQVTIENENNFSHSQYVAKIQKACNDAGADVMFAYLVPEENEDKVKEHRMFYTFISDDFLPVKFKNKFERANETTAYSTDVSIIDNNFEKDKITFIDVFYDYTVYPMNALNADQFKRCTCYADAADVVKLSKAMTEQKLSLKVVESASFVSNTLSNTLKIGIAVMLILTLFSMIFRQLSDSRMIAVKRLEGYSFFQIAAEFLYKFGVFYVITVSACFLFSIFYFSIASGFDLFILYISKMKMYLILVLVTLPLIFLLSCSYMFFVNPLLILKGVSKSTVFYLMTIISKMAIVIVLLLVLHINMKTFQECYNQVKAYQNVSVKLNNYYTITNTGYDEGMDERFKKFYDIVHKSYNAIMFHATSCSDPSFEGNIREWYVYINDNYLNFNPIYTPDGVQITYDDIKEDKATILAPYGISGKDIIEAHSWRFKDISEDEICVRYYNPDQKFYLLNIIDSKYPGYIMHPIAIMHRPGDGTTGIIANGELVFKAHTDNFNSEIKPLLRECEIDWLTGSTPSVESIFDDYISDKKFELFVYSLVIAVFVFLFVCTIIYEVMMYYKSKQKIFTILKMNGYSFAMIHRLQIIFRIITYVVIMATCWIGNISFVFGTLIISIDYIIFYSILESKTAEYSSVVLKGA